MNNNELKVGAILSYIQMGLSILIGLIYTPVMIQLLGQSEYGLYNTVSSTISMLSVLSLSFNSSYIRYYSIYKSQDDYNLIYKLNGLFLIIFTVIGCVALGCGIFLSFHLEYVFSEGLTAQEYVIARTLMLLLTVNLSFSFPMSVFSSIISANEKFVFLKIVGMINTIVGPMVTLPLLLMGYRSITMVFVSVIISFLTNALYVYYVLMVIKNKFIFHGFERRLFKSLSIYTLFITINMIVDQINWNIDKILLGRYKGTAAVAIYSVGYSIYSYYTLFSTSISHVFTPRIHNIVNETKGNLVEQKKQLTQLFSKVGRIQFIVLGLIASGFVFFGKNFITKFWAGIEYYDSYYVALLLILPASIALIQNLGIEIQRAQNKHKFRSIAYSFMALVNLLLSIYLCQIYGAVGSAIGTAISLILANGIIMNIYYYYRCNIDILIFWKNIMQLTKGIIIPAFVGIVITRFWKVNNFIDLAVQIFIYVIVYVISMWLWGINEFEKMLIFSGLKKVGLKNDKHN